MHRAIQNRRTGIIPIPLHTKLRIPSTIIPSTLPLLQLRIIREHRIVVSIPSIPTLRITETGETGNGVPRPVSHTHDPVSDARVVVYRSVVGDLEACVGEGAEVEDLL